MFHLSMAKTKVTAFTKVVIEKNSSAWIVECQHCKGSGQKYPGYGNTHSKSEYECPTCSGKGVNKISVKSDESLFKCKHCKGSGKKYPGYGNTHSKREYQCPTCSGYGVLALKKGRVECGNCDGTGKKYPGYGNTHSKREYQCNTCGGAGSNSI